jgi:hypothetical protein
MVAIKSQMMNASTIELGQEDGAAICRTMPLVYWMISRIH